MSLILYFKRGIYHKLCITDYNIFHNLIAGLARAPNSFRALRLLPPGPLSAGLTTTTTITATAAVDVVVVVIDIIIFAFHGIKWYKLIFQCLSQINRLKYLVAYWFK